MGRDGIRPMLFKHFVEELSIFSPFRPIKNRKRGGWLPVFCFFGLMGGEVGVRERMLIYVLPCSPAPFLLWLGLVLYQFQVRIFCDEFVSGEGFARFLWCPEDFDCHELVA